MKRRPRNSSTRTQGANDNIKEPSGPISGITPENYQHLGNQFIAANGGKTFLICQRPCIKNDEYPATPKQWNAWLAFFERKKIKHRMNISPYYTVPTEWPSQFTSDAVPYQPVEIPGGHGEQLASSPSPLPQPQPFRPYPKLWQFFADDAEATAMLDRGLPFEFVTSLSRDMAMGLDRRKLRKRLVEKFNSEEAFWKKKIRREIKGKISRGDWAFTPKPPPFDVSDFPDAPTKEWNWKDPLAEDEL